MGANSKIEWTHHTFNAWTGCEKVSPACAHCYAEIATPVRVARSRGLELWGGDVPRKAASEAVWAEPERWNAAAAAVGEWHRVFCLSMGDVFEAFNGPIVDAKGCRLNQAAAWGRCQFVPLLPHFGAGPATIIDLRERLFSTIARTQNLAWLLLTKRLDEAATAIPLFAGHAVGSLMNEGQSVDDPVIQYTRANLSLPNVWLGATVEDRKHGVPRIAKLRSIPAAIRFLSIEPLLEDLGTLDLRGIDWVIVGGESGHGARPMRQDWARSIRDQCARAGVRFFFKQWGEWCPFSQLPEETMATADLMEIPSTPMGSHAVHKVGKKGAGRQLDGREWDEVPAWRPL